MLRGAPFIVNSNSPKADPATRKLIRSYVMRGRTRKKRVAHDEIQSMITWRTATSRIQLPLAELREAIRAYTPLVPGRVGSDISCTGFVDEIEPFVFANLIKREWLVMFTVFDD